MRMAIDRPETAGGHYQLFLTSPAIHQGGVIPRKYVEISPPLAWTPVPGAASYVVIVEDADAGDKTLGLPFVHWLAWNIPYNAKALPEGASTKAGNGIVEGRNHAGKIGYFGPHPPPGPPHHYYFQLFAISNVLKLPAGASREQVFGAIKDEVVGKGELVATYQSGR
jgi:Raf kinase inhibitor-like YbhB/YbcL family protein